MKEKSNSKMILDEKENKILNENYENYVKNRKENTLTLIKNVKNSSEKKKRKKDVFQTKNEIFFIEKKSNNKLIIDIK